MIDLGIHRDDQDILTETDKAYHVMLRAGVPSFGSARPVWLPKSKVQWLSPQAGMAETMHVPAWLARKI